MSFPTFKRDGTSLGIDYCFEYLLQKQHFRVSSTHLDPLEETPPCSSLFYKIRHQTKKSMVASIHLKGREILQSSLLRKVTSAILEY